MDVFIYFFEKLGYGLDEIEDIIDDAFEGIGEVTGSGTGESGSNIDIEIFDDDIDKATVLNIIQNALNNFNIPSSTLIKLNGEEIPFAPKG